MSLRIGTELLKRAWEAHEKGLRGAGEGEEHLPWRIPKPFVGSGVTADLGQTVNILPFALAFSLALWIFLLGMADPAPTSSSRAGFPLPCFCQYFQFAPKVVKLACGVLPSSRRPWPSWSDTFQSHQVGETQALPCSCPSEPVAVLCLARPAEEDPRVALQLEGRALAFPVLFLFGDTRKLQAK